jgi:hypothetical protein
VETRERNKVDGKLSEVAVELTWEAKRAGNARHAGRNEVVQVAISWGGELESSEANVIESFIVQHHHLVCILNELVNRKGGVVWLNDCVRHLGGWADGKCEHDSVWVLLADLGDEESAHS